MFVGLLQFVSLLWQFITLQNYCFCIYAFDFCHVVFSIWFFLRLFSNLFSFFFSALVFVDFSFSFSTVIIRLSFFLRVFSCFFSIFEFLFELFLEKRSLFITYSFVLVYVQLGSLFSVISFSVAICSCIDPFLQPQSGDWWMTDGIVSKGG